MLFQFHKGAIRTRVSMPASFSSRVFQFHKGAIRTEKAAAIANVYAHFNSIKVRLERSR